MAAALGLQRDWHGALRAFLGRGSGGRGWLHDVFVEPGDDQEDAESDD